MSWTYHQSNGELYDSAGDLIGTGYSGSPIGKNDPADQDIADVGPIPCGDYTIGEPFNAVDTGPYSMDLSPAPTNEMFGRSGFRMHGDSIAHPGCASEGCVIMPPEVRQAVWQSGDHALVVAI
jgi:hypothetical protein